MVSVHVLQWKLKLFVVGVVVVLGGSASWGQQQDTKKTVYRFGRLNPGWYKCQVTCNRLAGGGSRITGTLGDLCAVFEEGEQIGQFVVPKPMNVVYQTRGAVDIQVGQPVRMPVLAEPGNYRSAKWDLKSVKMFADYAMVRVRPGFEREQNGQARLFRKAGLKPAFRFWVHPAYGTWPMKLRNGKPYDGTKFRPWLGQAWEAFSTWVLELTRPGDFVILDFETYGDDKWDNFAHHEPSQLEDCKLAVTKWMPTDRQYVILPQSWLADLPRATSEALAAAGARVWFRAVSQRPPANASAMWYVEQSWHEALPKGCGFSAHGWITIDNAAVWAKHWTNYAAVGGVPIIWCEDPLAWTIAANALKEKSK